MSDPAARFHLISGNRLDVLAAHLAARLAHPPDPDSLAPETILIPQPTLRHWLERSLAERLGVIANLDLCTPSEFVWRLLRASQPRLPDVSPWDRPRLRWRLYDLLATTPAEHLPDAVRAHLARAGAGMGARDRDALARDALADAVAAAFDKYQAYRRDWLTLWERGGDGDDWQAVLWRALRARAPDRPHRAALIGDWLARHDRRHAAATPPPGLPPRLAAFGTIHVSPDVLHMLAVVGQWSALDFYLPTPSAEYWGDVERLRVRLRRDGPDALPAALAEAQADNPLLQAWGGGGREIVAQLFAYDVVEPQHETECFVPAGRDTLLHRLQQDVLERAAPVRAHAGHGDDHDAADGAPPAGDVSLQLHACHSKLREIEVLHDQLRALLDDDRFDPPLAPHDIVVLAPDIAEYLPLARAVFGGLPADDPRHIPFSLADRPQAQAYPLVRVFLELLALGERPLTASRFRDVLAASAFARTLDGARRARIDDWIEAVGIRWGEDADAREREGVGRWREYSFAFGIERLLGGYALADARPFGAAATDGGDDTVDDALLAPYPELEGADAELLDGTLSLLARLRTLGAWMRGTHTAEVWRAGLVEAFDALFAPLEDVTATASVSQAARRCIVETLDTFAENAVDGGALPVALVRRVLDEALSQPSAHQPWLSGGVTFAGMVPLRTVPFRVICLLGLDAEAYPRRETGDDINRLVDAVQGRAPRRLGDRSVRDDDRFLFLQLLCAADDVFYLSYGGRDARDGSVREPSPVIAELLDAVEAMQGEAAREALCVHHPLQSFSPRAFGAGDGVEDSAGMHGGEGGTAEPRRFSYRREWRMPTVDAASLRMAPSFVPPVVSSPVPSGGVASGVPSDENIDDTPDRHALQRFFANPAKVWLRDRLGIRLPETEDRTPDREPLGVDGLLRYGALDALLDVDDEALDDASRQLRARGLLPPGRDGERLAESVRASALRLREARAVRLAGRTATVVRDDAGRGVDFRFDDVHDGQRVVISAGRLDGKRRLRAGIEHLLLASALGDTADTRLLGLDKGKGKEKDAEVVVEAVWTGIDRDQARERLDVLLALWREGRHAPLPFAPKSAYAYAESFRTRRDPVAAWRAAMAAYAPYRMSGEQDDAWLRLAFRPQGLLDDMDGPIGRRFREIALQVFDATGTGA